MKNIVFACLSLALLSAGCASGPRSGKKIPLARRDVPQVPQRSLAKFFSTRGVPLIQITESPQDKLVSLRGTAEFSVDANPPDAQFQWRLNGVVLTNRTSRTLIVTNVSTNDLGEYDCVITTPIEHVISPMAVLSAYTTRCADLPPAIQAKCGQLAAGMLLRNPDQYQMRPMSASTNVGNEMILIGRTVVAPPGPPPPDPVCPYPYVARMRIPDGLSTVTKVPSSSYWVYDVTDNPTKITYHGDWYFDRGCGVNGPVYVTTGISTEFFFVVHFPSAAMVPAAGSYYYLYVYGFAP